MLSIRRLRKRFGARVLFDDLDFDLGAGEFVAIMGESGSGKSTLLNLIAGLDRPDAGSVEFDGIEITGLAENERARFRRSHLGFVFQAFHLLPYLSVADNVALPLVLAGCATAERTRRVDAMLGKVGLGDRGDSATRELSGGEMQRAAIARALVHGPRLLLCDEPTGNLDIGHAGQVLALVRAEIDRNRTACILVTHSRLAAAAADRVYRLDAGGLHLER